MTERLFEGMIYETPFPRVLFSLWRREATGHLRLTKGDEEKTLYFDKGRIVVDRKNLGEKEFLKALVKKRILTAEQARRCERHAATHKVPVLRDLTELELISPLPLWNLMESFFVRRLFPVFDWEEGRFVFDPSAPLLLGEALSLLPTLDIILQGIRQMKNSALVGHNLPAEDEPIYVSAPYFLHLLALEPHEKYVLATLQLAANLKSIFELSELGGAACRKTLYAFTCLDIVCAPEKNAKARTPGTAEAPSAEQGKILTALNEKCACVHRYITKQIGPLARTIIGNCLEDIKPALGPMFQKMRLQEDGRIEIDSAMVANVNHLPEDLFRAILRGFDEILTAEVLAVKKSLGAGHESTLVKNLEKIGCL